MSYQGLADFLEELGQAGELVRVDAEVDPVLEAAEVTNRIASSGGPALIFGSVRGHDLPLLTNLLGTEERVCRALGVHSLTELSQKVDELVRPQNSDAWYERLKTAPTRAGLSKLPPHSVKTGPCQQVVRLAGDVDLGSLPALQSRPDEPGPTITAGQVFTVDPDCRHPVVGRYDLAVLDRDRLAVCWGPHEPAARLPVEYGRRNEQVPLAVVLGGDPAGLLAAMAPLPAEADVRALAGLLRGKPLEMVACRSVDLEVPADAEIVIEGFVDPAESPANVGPLCGPTGYYTHQRPAPVIRVTAITHRTNPIYPAIVPGEPPHEACVIHRALQQVFLPLVKQAIEELVDCDLPAFGTGRHWALVSIRKNYAGQARQVALRIWGLPWLMFSKLMVIVDEDVDVHDHDQVWSAVAANFDPGRDVVFHQGPPDPWDPAAVGGTLGNRMAIDATTKLTGESTGKRCEKAAMSEEIRRLVGGRWSEYGLGPEPGAAKP